MMYRFLYIVSRLTVFVTVSVQGQAPTPSAVVTVDVHALRSDTSRRPIGINLDYMTDRPSLFAPGARSLSDALDDLGVHYLRYPGGEKSQSSLWSTPPFDRPKPALSRTGPNEFWSSLRTYTGPDGKTLIDPMNFDEFMDLCQKINCVPDLVVNHNSYLGSKTSPGSTVPTRSQLIQTAAAWVRYSNVTKKYRVRYWEIGNETYMKAYNGPRQEPAEYGQDVRDFSKAMKLEDSAIKIGVSGNSYEYYRDMLKVAADDTDFLVIHTYPCCASYAAYQHTARFDGSIDAARNALADLSPAQRAHIGMALTEVNALDFIPGHKDVNDLGHAMLLFEILAQYMAYDSDVEFEEVWNTRWIDNNKTSEPPSIFDTLDNRNTLNATGLAMSFLSHGLLSKMGAISIPQSDGLVTGYAMTDGKRHTNIFLVNRDLSPRAVRVMMQEGRGTRTSSTKIFNGSGPDDLHPHIVEGSPLTFHKGQGATVLAPASITEIEIATER